MARRLSIVVGLLLPFVTVGLGLLVPRSAASTVLIPASFVVSGILIGRWWAFVPSMGIPIVLGLAELVTPTSRYGTATEIHAGGFDVGFLLLTLSIATALSLAGAIARVAVSALLRRVGIAQSGTRTGS
jgi:hypothetical protein